MDIATKIAILKSRKDKLLSRGFYNFRIANKLQRKIYALEKQLVVDE